MNNKIKLIEALPHIKHIAKCYGLKLNVLSDFKIAKTIWARSLS
tara:strand:- start:34 stop:165 length:132 start_codon:yes stop_codon:yes gene_type:complete